MDAVEDRVVPDNTHSLLSIIYCLYSISLQSGVPETDDFQLIELIPQTVENFESKFLED